MAECLCEISNIPTSGYYKYITKATKEHTVILNILDREFKRNISDKVMLTNITYMLYVNSKIEYLSIIKDFSTNKILTYNPSTIF